MEILSLMLGVQEGKVIENKEVFRKKKRKER